MITSRFLRSLSVSFKQTALSLNRKAIRQPTFLRVMSVSNAPHPVSSTAEPPKAAEGLEPVTASASSTPAAAKQAQSKEGKQGKPKKDKGGGGGGGSGGPLELNPPPGYFEERIKIFDEWKAKYDADVAGESAFGVPFALDES